MRKRKWYERMSAAALIAVLLVNHGDMGIMAKAETIPALEENLEEENKKIEAETASASNADEKRDTTVDSNETTVFNQCFQFAYPPSKSRIRVPYVLLHHFALHHE